MQEYKMPAREQNSNKGTFGKIINFAGSKNYIGAAYLSTVSPLKVGAGFVALASERDIIKSVSALLPEAVYLSPKQGLKDIEKYSVVLIGCGLGNNKKLFKDVIKKLENKTTPIVIDADGLNILADIGKNSTVLTPHPSLTVTSSDISPTKKMLWERNKFKNNLYPLIKERELVITPHPLEAARLLNTSLDNVLNNLKDSAKKLSEKYNCVTVLKTHRTIICDKDNLFINQHGNSALAKAGSGDVLAGIIAGLLAQGCRSFEAAKLGVYLHSRAGEIASEELTEYGVLASDIPNYLHKAIREICI